MSKADKRARQADAARRRMVGRARKTVIWVMVLAGVGALLYVLATTSGVRFDENDLAVVDFSGLTASQKRTALQAANAARCTCGCGMDVAQCVATDSSCPVRTTNIDKIRKMVEDARQ
jgi:hypothetical protein